MTNQSILNVPSYFGCFKDSAGRHCIHVDPYAIRQVSDQGFPEVVFKTMGKVCVVFPGEESQPKRELIWSLKITEVMSHLCNDGKLLPVGRTAFIYVDADANTPNRVVGLPFPDAKSRTGWTWRLIAIIKK